MARTLCFLSASAVAGLWLLPVTALAHWEPTTISPTPDPVAGGGIVINEVRIDQDGGDDDEFFELLGPPGASLDGLDYIVIGDNPSGNIEMVVTLDGQVIPPSGFFVVAEASFGLGVADHTTNLNMENGDTVTHMLVDNFTGSVGDSIDADVDGDPDFTPWDSVLDTVAVIEFGGEDLPYGPPLACSPSPICQDAALPGGLAMMVFRCPDATGEWNFGGDDVDAPGAGDSPGAANPCACGDGVVTAGEACDDGGESASCDLDCTAAECGDTTVNPTAGEECDEGGETATCDADCTAPACGDGVVNMAAGEDCDDGGESAACNADCTVAACGDGVVNAAAGEDCDDGGESATCDDDCTAAVCGDSVVNITAGEQCDEGERTDSCNADCTTAGCGDGIVNKAAGEACDGDGRGTGGETEACDLDCSPAECGDGTVNPTAGEDCDDGNTDDGDGCSSACTDEGGSSGGDSTGDGADSDSGGADDTTGGDETPPDPTTGALTLDGGSGASDDGVPVPPGQPDPGTDGCSCRGPGGSSTAWWALLLLGGLRRRRR